MANPLHIMASSWTRTGPGSGWERRRSRGRRACAKSWPQEPALRLLGSRPRPLFLRALPELSAVGSPGGALPPPAGAPWTKLASWNCGAYATRAEAGASATEGLHNDKLWRRKMLSARPAKQPRFRREPAEEGLWTSEFGSEPAERALEFGRGAVCAAYADASGNHGRGATACANGQEAWAARSWWASWVLKKSMEMRGPQMWGRLVLARMDNSTAASHAHHGAGRSPQLAMLACGMLVSLRCPVAARHIAGRGNSVAGALPRFTGWVQRRGQHMVVTT